MTEKPVERFLLNKLEALKTAVFERYGEDFTVKELLQSPKLLLEGLVWYNALILTRIPEITFFELNELVSSVKKSRRKPQ